MYELLTYRPAFGQPSGSPFCVKAMCLLNLAGAEWRRVDTDDPRKMPHGKMPVLRDAGRLIPDSEAIRAHLEARGADLDPGLGPRDRAAARALIRLADEHFYFLILHDRWADDRVWPHIRAAYFGSIPRAVRAPVTALIRRGVTGAIKGQGIGRMTAQDRAARAEADLAAIAVQLGDRAFLFGDAPTAADASVGPMLAAAAASPVKTALSARVGDDSALVAYAQRVADALYP